MFEELEKCVIIGHIWREREHIKLFDRTISRTETTEEESCELRRSIETKEQEEKNQKICELGIYGTVLKDVNRWVTENQDNDISTGKVFEVIITTDFPNLVKKKKKAHNYAPHNYIVGKRTMCRQSLCFVLFCDEQRREKDIIRYYLLISRIKRRFRALFINRMLA